MKILQHYYSVTRLFSLILFQIVLILKYYSIILQLGVYLH